MSTLAELTKLFSQYITSEMESAIELKPVVASEIAYEVIREEQALRVRVCAFGSRGLSGCGLIRRPKTLILLSG